MKTIKTMKAALAVSLMLLAATALAASNEKDLICHIGNEAGPNGEVYLDDPGCVPHEDNGYFCPDAGKIDLIEVAKASKHLNNPNHAWDGVADYLPEDRGASGEGDEDLDGDGIDEGCELPTLLGECPCWAGEDLSAFTLDNLYPGETPVEYACDNTAQRVYWGLALDIDLRGQFDMGGYYDQPYGTGCGHAHFTNDDQGPHLNDQDPISQEQAEICMAEALYVGSQLGVSCID